MARTIAEIYNAMIAEKTSMGTLYQLQPNIDSMQTLLTNLTSAAKVASWRLKFFVVATANWSIENLFDEHKAWIDNRAAELAYGSLPWYEAVIKAFQYGADLSWDGKRYVYDPIDASQQIITRASAIEVGGQVVIKVAKNSGTTIEPLTSTELDAFLDYMKQVKPAGVRVLAFSREPDTIHQYWHIYYDPLLLSSTGELLSSPGTFPVEDAINSYISTGIPFNGTFSVNEQAARIQAATGVVNPVFEAAEAKYGTGLFSAINDYYVPNAGYMIVDPANPLSDTISYIPAL